MTATRREASGPHQQIAPGLDNSRRIGGEMPAEFALRADGLFAGMGKLDEEVVLFSRGQSG
jgi:hypothetical protein